MVVARMVSLYYGSFALGDDDDKKIGCMVANGPFTLDDDDKLQCTHFTMTSSHCVICRQDTKLSSSSAKEPLEFSHNYTKLAMLSFLF